MRRSYKAHVCYLSLNLQLQSSRERSKPWRAHFECYGRLRQDNRAETTVCSGSAAPPALQNDIHSETRKELISMGFCNNHGMRGYLGPAIPLFVRTFTSTLRFSARPDAVSFEAAAWVSPIAAGDTICRIGTLHS